MLKDAIIHSSVTYKNQSRKLSYQTDKEATEEMHFRNYKVSETA